MKTFTIVCALACLAMLALSEKVNDPKIKGYCGEKWHKWSGCEWRNSPDGSARGYGINRQPIICWNDIPGFTTRSRHCVEGILCGDSNCDKQSGDKATCVQDMLDECASLRRTYTGNL